MAMINNPYSSVLPVAEQASSTPASTRDAFVAWLSVGNAKKFSPQAAVACLDRISEYVISKKISCSIWEISKSSMFQPVYQRILNEKLLRVIQKDTFKVFIVAGQLYAKFLKENPITLKEEITAIAERNDGVVAVESDTIREDINSDSVVAWLVTQPNANGTLYLKNVVRAYMFTLRNAPRKLMLEASQSRNVFGCHTLLEFDELWTAFKAAPNYTDVNRTLGHGQFSAGLAAYRRYIEYLEENGHPVNNDQIAVIESTSKTIKDISRQLTTEPLHVDFAHPELCMGCDPQTCIVDGKSFSGRNWRDILVALTEDFLQSKPKAMELYHTSPYPNGEREFLIKEKPKFSARQLSNGYWINVNLSIKDLVFTIGRLCKFCGVDLNDVNITCVPKQSAGELRPINIIKDDSARFAQQIVRDTFRAWLITHNPKWSSGTVTMHYSDAYYLYNNKRGITLEEALTADDGLQRAYDAIERFYTDNPTQTNNPSGSARGYLRSLRMLKEFLVENYPELLSANSVAISAPSVPDAVVDALNKNYASGFRFDTTYVNLLSSSSGVEIDGRMQSALKHIMFRRDDGIYFLLDIVANAAIRKDIIDFADSYLEEYGCFEIPEFYKLYEKKVNPNCIRNAEDFESFYEQIGKSGIRCVQAPYIGNRIARYSNGAVWSTFKEVAAKIVSVINEEYYGSCNEDDLHTKFCAFSTDLLGKIIRQYAVDELIRVEINDSVCYQTFDALGLPENFSEVLAEALERLSDIGLDPTQDALHTTLSLKLGVNFKAEYNLPDWDIYRRLITAFYKAEPRREWKYNIFGEVAN